MLLQGMVLILVNRCSQAQIMLIQTRNSQANCVAQGIMRHQPGLLPIALPLEQ